MTLLHTKAQRARCLVIKSLTCKPPSSGHSSVQTSWREIVRRNPGGCLGDSVAPMTHRP